MELSELQKEAHAIARDKGWWDQERTFGDLIALIHSELSEALEAYRERGLETWSTLRMDEGAGPITLSSISDLDTLKARLGEAALEKPEGVASELADVVIRVADMAEFYGMDLVAVRIARSYVPLWVQSFGDWITALHLSTTMIMSCASLQLHADSTLPIPNVEDWKVEARDTIERVYLMAAHYGIDLDVAIVAKKAYNRTRPYRHGGKAL